LLLWLTLAGGERERAQNSEGNQIAGLADDVIHGAAL
jgi:hypothetical protein